MSEPVVVYVAEAAGVFAENKERAKQLRTKRILPALRRGDEVVLDFGGVNAATQSFVHALVAEAVRMRGPHDGLELLEFRNCAPNVRSIVEIVVSYCQDDWSTTAEIDPIAE